jgi:hypothetical protein
MSSECTPLIKPILVSAILSLNNTYLLLTFTHPIVLLAPTTDSWSLTTLAHTNLAWALQPYSETGTGMFNITLDGLNNLT